MDIVIDTIHREILRAKVQDYINILKDVEGEYWREEHFLMELPGKYNYSCYASLADDLAGYIISSKKSESEIHIHKFMVAEKYRSRKIGLALLLYLVDISLAENIKTITLKVNKQNTRAIAFYMRNGFQILSFSLEMKNSDSLIMKKVL